MRASSVVDLLALATVRRLLLELGHELQPETPGTLVGPLELWLHEPRPQLDGRSPMQALQEQDGEKQVRECLRELLALATVSRSETARSP